MCPKNKIKTEKMQTVKHEILKQMNLILYKS